jgi:hypothetical protein
MLKNKFKFVSLHLVSTFTLILSAIILFSFSAKTSFAIQKVETVEKSWADLVPSQEELYSGSVYVLQSLEGYVDFDIRMITSSNPNFKNELAQKYCLKNQNILILNMSCLNLLRNSYADEFDQVLKEFITFYDSETPSYKTVIKNADYQELANSTVLKRLNSIIPNIALGLRTRQ